MKLSNFRFIEKTGTNALSWCFWAEVDIETGSLWWKKKYTSKVKREYGGGWFFVESGKWCPGFVVEAMGRSWEAKTGEKTG